MPAQQKNRLPILLSAKECKSTDITEGITADATRRNAVLREPYESQTRATVRDSQSLNPRRDENGQSGIQIPQVHRIAAAERMAVLKPVPSEKLHPGSRAMPIDSEALQGRCCAYT